MVDILIVHQILPHSLDGKYLISLGNSGPCRVWDLTSLTAVASLTRENVRNFILVTSKNLFLRRVLHLFLTLFFFLNQIQGEVFGFCRFSRRTDSNQILYLTSMQGKYIFLSVMQGKY